MKTTRMTQEIRQRIVAMARRGVAQKTIADELERDGTIKTTQQTISAVLRASDPDGYATGRRTKLDSRSPRIRSPATTKPAPPPLPPAPAPTPQALDEPDILKRRIQGRIRQAGRLADEAASHGNLAGFAVMAKLQAELTDRLVRLTPPSPPDPAIDPAHVEAREKLRADFEAHLAALVARGAAA